MSEIGVNNFKKPLCFHTCRCLLRLPFSLNFFITLSLMLTKNSLFQDFILHNTCLSACLARSSFTYVVLRFLSVKDLFGNLVEMVRVEISLSDILEYVGNRSRPLKEGEAVFKAGHVTLCGLVTEQAEVIKSLCLKTSALTEPPHEITINHEDLKRISCTEVQQKWGQEKKEVKDMYKAKPFSEFCHPVIKKNESIGTSLEVNRNNFDLLVSAVGNSSLSLFIQRGRDSPPHKKRCGNINLNSVAAPQTSDECVVMSSIAQERLLQDQHIEIIINSIEGSEFLKKLNIATFPNLQPCCQAVVTSLQSSDYKKIARTIQGSDEWKQERQLRITGSTCYSVYTYGNRNPNWEQKSISFFFPKGFSNKFVEYGISCEKEALNRFKANTSFDIATCSLIVCKLMPWLAYSPDGIIMDNGVPKSLLEIKCPYIGKEKGTEHFFDYCNYLVERNGEVVLKTHHSYYAQIQLGMALLNLKSCYFIVYSSFSNSYIQIIVPFNDSFAKDLIDTVTDKYFNNMLHYYCENKDHH